jgi:DNA-binding LytR/AlgR family response regulator
MKILIVEDEPLAGKSLYNSLKSLEYDPFLPCQTPREAIAIIRHDQPSLAILDLELENGQSGLEVAAYIQKERLKIPFIILTSHTEPETIAEVRKYNPASYLVKPFQKSSLYAAIEIALPFNDTSNELFLKSGTRHEKLNMEELKYLKTEGKYTELHFTFGKRLIRSSLTAFMEDYPKVEWLRVHKSYAVNPAFITAVASDSVTLSNESIPVGRIFQPNINQYVKQSSGR